MKPWIKKYSPTVSKNIIGQDKAVEKLRNFITNYKKHSAMLLYGPSGTGKTSTVHALAKELNLELIELNASDFRNKDQINRIVNNSISQMSLFMKQKIILIDELDGISGTKDRGGIPEIISLIKKTPYPIVLTANDPWDKRFYKLRSTCQLADFHTLNYLSIAKALENICEKESITYEKDDLKTLARRAGGDLRAAINDLQIITLISNKVTKEDIAILSERDKTEKITNALLRVFKTTDFDIALSAYNEIQEDLKSVTMFIDENLPLEYEKDDLARAFDKLSKANQFSGRIRKRQEWRFLVYINYYLSVGIALAKKEKYKKFVQYKKNQRIGKMFFAKAAQEKKKGIAKKISEQIHCSSKEVFQNVLPYLKTIQKKYNVLEQFKLNKEEIAYITK